MEYITRTLEPVLRRTASTFRAIELTGPRQAGKTTLLKHLFGDTHAYVSLDDAANRRHALEDPRGFLQEFAPPLIVDEFQRAPDLVGYIKLMIDDNASAKGAFILTGSQNLGATHTVPESLAGRVAIMRLFPLTSAELRGEPQAPLLWEPAEEIREARPASVREAWTHMLRGWYPEVALDPTVDPALWHASYLHSYVQRDVEELRDLADPLAYNRFVQVLASRAAMLLDVTDIARNVDVSPGTIRAWLSLLVGTYQVFLARPFSANIGKRVTKHPKVYFTDTGTLCSLVGLQSIDHALNGPMAGQIVENAVAADVHKGLSHRLVGGHLWFYRTHAGLETDLIVDIAGSLVPIEVKASGTASHRWARTLERVREDLGPERTAPGFVVHPGQVKSPIGKGIIAVPFRDM